ncbi:MAG: hypothetical protein KIS66_04740 [Fimbriimonadaceae bacterium]|nr:hypothetical protein [Fimbriimonadaceae bacterium]
MRHRSCRSLIVAVLAGLVLAVVWACGGATSGPKPILVRDVSEAIARATTRAEMERAFGRLFDLVGIADGQARTTLMQFAQPHLDSGGVDHGTFRESYEALLSRLAADPRTAGYVLDLTAEQFLATVNGRLAAAYADPNTPQNAVYVLLSSRPGHVPYAAPQMTLDEGVTVVQVMVMLVVYGNVWTERNGDSIVPSPVLASAKGLPARPAGPCQDACQATFAGCDQSCGNAFSLAMQQTLAGFREQIRPILINVVVIVSGAASIYSMLYLGCHGDAACQQTLVDAKNASIAYAQQHLAEGLAQANLVYAGQVVRNRDAFQSCRTGCNQALAVCLEGCHNQGGG